MDRSTAERLLAALPAAFHMKTTPLGEWIIYLTGERYVRLRALVREAEQVVGNRKPDGAPKVEHGTREIDSVSCRPYDFRVMIAPLTPEEQKAVCDLLVEGMSKALLKRFGMG